MNDYKVWSLHTPLDPVKAVCMESAMTRLCWMWSISPGMGSAITMSGKKEITCHGGQSTMQWKYLCSRWDGKIIGLARLIMSNSLHIFVSLSFHAYLMQNRSIHAATPIVFHTSWEYIYLLYCFTLLPFQPYLLHLEIYHDYNAAIGCLCTNAIKI